MTKILNKTKSIKTRLSQEEWGSMKWLLDDSMVSGANMSVAAMTIKKGKTSPAHRHSNCNEFLQVAEGIVEVTINKDKVVLEKGDGVYCPAGTAHGIENLGDGDAKMIICYSGGKRKYESVT
jgi:quercetin dioxygenase-like cupin family protein